MPALMTLRFAAPPHPQPPRVLLGAACRVFETAESDHAAAVKPFAVGPLRPCVRAAGPRDYPTPARAGGGGPAELMEWRLGWLPDSPPPRWPPATLGFHDATYPVLGDSRDSYPFALLAGTPPTRRVTMRALTPLFFSRNGRDLPLPEPVLMVRSLVTRWNAHAPPDLAIADQNARAVADTVYLAAMAEGRTVNLATGPRLRQAGFVGDVELALLRAASAQTASLFGALMRFAPVAGVGAQTTHGFGAVELLPARHTHG